MEGQGGRGGRWRRAARVVTLATWLCVAAQPAQAANILGCTFDSAADLVRLARREGYRVLDAKGKFLAGLRNYYAPPVPFGNLPRSLIGALVVSEDRRFFDHGGIDLIGIGRAVIENIRAMRIAQGGSTLTQQTLKNTCFQGDPKLMRKVKEVLCAGDLEATLTKQDILEVYLNTVLFGGTNAQIWGIQAASRVYLDKYVRDLTPLEAALLVQLLPAPNRYSPHAASARARQRAERLLDRMVELGQLSAKAARDAKEQKLKITPEAQGLPGYYRPGLGVGWFAEWARRESERALGRQPGVVTLVTTLRPEVQTIANRHLAVALKRHAAKLKVQQGAVIVMDREGNVLAMVGGRDFRRLQWNNATQAKRQPGSAFKPLVYLAALQRGLRPSDLVLDKELVLRSGTIIRNHDNIYRGQIPLSEALAQSSNTAVVRLVIGHVPEVVAVADRLGLTTPLTKEVGLALGISEVTLLDLTAVYAAIANGGFKVTPRAFREVRDNQGQTLWCREPTPRQRVIRAEHAKALKEMLAGAVRAGTGQRADPGFFAAGKTGTTDDYRNVWFIGFTDRFVVGVWLGNEKSTPMRKVTGGGLPAEIWRDIVREAHKLPRLKPGTRCAGAAPWRREAGLLTGEVPR